MIKSLAVTLALAFGLVGQSVSVTGCPALLPVCLPNISVPLPHLPLPFDLPSEPQIPKPQLPAVPSPVPQPSPVPAPEPVSVPAPTAPQPYIPQYDPSVPASGQVPVPEHAAPIEPPAAFVGASESTTTPEATPEPARTPEAVDQAVSTPAEAIVGTAGNFPDLTLLVVILLLIGGDFVQRQYSKRKLRKNP